MAKVQRISMQELYDSIGFEEYPDCKCGHSWEAHAKPESKISWDVCSFECTACDCSEFDSGDDANAGMRDGGKRA